MVHGCVCDSSWAVGYKEGETQLAEYFGGDCSLSQSSDFFFVFVFCFSYIFVFNFWFYQNYYYLILFNIIYLFIYLFFIFRKRNLTGRPVVRSLWIVEWRRATYSEILRLVTGKDNNKLFFLSLTQFFFIDFLHCTLKIYCVSY